MDQAAGQKTHKIKHTYVQWHESTNEKAGTEFSKAYGMGRTMRRQNLSS